MTNLGASLKKSREARGISLGQIAARTKISTRFLAAIENEEFHLLPGGIFNRGFVRSFAECVGLDPDQAVADYERLVAATQPDEPAPATRPARETWSLYPLAAAALILLIIAFYIVTRDSSNSVANITPPPQAVTPPQPAPPPAIPSPQADLPPAPEPQPVAASNLLAIEVSAVDRTWIKVTADGSTIEPGEILERGMSRRFTAQASIQLVVGNAGGLTVKINEQPAKPLGQSGQVRQVTITPENVKDFIG